MTFEEKIKENDTVIINFKIEGKVFDFPAKVIKIKGSKMVTEPVIVDDSVLALYREDIFYEVFIADEKAAFPYCWSFVKCQKAVSNKHTVYVFTNGRNGHKVNRRSSFRVEILMDGIVQIDEHTGTVGVTVMDVSNTGFSFVCDKVIEDIKNKPVRLNFVDGNATINLTGYVVNSNKRGENRIRYGCRLPKINDKLCVYIAYKQRERMKHNAQKKQEQE